MATVTVSGVVKDETGRKDSRDWKAFSPVYREGSDGEVVTMRKQQVRVVAGVFTAKLDPGVCVLENPDGQRYTVTVPDEDADLWDVIAAAVAIPPGTPADELNAAVTAYFDANPVDVGPEGPPNVLEIGTVVSGPTADATITGTSPTQTLNLTLPKGDKGDPGTPGTSGDWATLTNKPAVIAAGADAATARSVISAQASDSDLTAIAALSPANDDVVQRKSGAWTNRTPAQLKSDMALNRGDFGLGNVDNTADAAKPVSTATQTALNGKQSTSEKGQPNGYAPLDATGTVAAAYLPSYIDDVLEYANLGTFPSVGEPGKIYTALNTNKIYRWSGSVYIEISPSPGSTDAVTEGAANLYYTNARADARIAAALGVSVQAYSAVLAALSGKASPAGQLVGTTDSQVLTGKTISGASNTLSNIALAALAASGTANNTTYLRGDGQWSAPGSTTPSQFGAYASRPAAGSAGLFYYCTDCDAVFRDNGSSWDRVRFGRGGTTQALPPTLAGGGWTDLNIGSTTMSDSLDGISSSWVSNGATNVPRGKVRALSPTSNYTLTGYVEPGVKMANYSTGPGLLLRDSSSGNVIFFGFEANSSSFLLRAVKFNSSGGSPSDYLNAPFVGGMANWLRIRDDGTNRYYEYSLNGVDWLEHYRTGRTDYITPNQYGIGADPHSQPIVCRYRSLAIT